MQLDEQILAPFARLKQPEPVREWFQKMLRPWINDQEQESRSTADDVQRKLTGCCRRRYGARPANSPDCTRPAIG